MNTIKRCADRWRGYTAAPREIGRTAGRETGLIVRCCAGLATLLMAAGCGPLTVTPSTYATIATSDSWSNSPPYSCPPETAGLFQFNPGPRQAAAGIDLVFDDGTEPLPCQSWHGVLAKANIRFDQAELRDTLGSLSFSSAKLKFRMTSSGRTIGGADLPGVGCLLRLGVAAERWPAGITRLRAGAPGSRPGFSLVSPEAFLIRAPLPSDFVRPADVTAEIRAWLDGTSPNHGFVLIPFAAPDAPAEMELGRLRRLNARCSAIISDARLEISGR